MRLIALMMEATSTSETSVNFYQTTRRNIPEVIFILVTAKTLSLTKIMKSFTLGFCILL
jgi:hypothetical protein